MTNAPAAILAERRLWLDTIASLDPLAVGIVGDDNHAKTGSSYHLGKSALRPDSYSIIESTRDREGLTEDAAAIDVGYWSISVDGTTHTLRTYNAWLIRQCVAGAPDTHDIREVIYSLDGKTVKRWDRLGRRTTGDSSHLSHTHKSYFRDSTRRDKTALTRRYFTEIGLIEGDDMTTKAEFISWLKDDDVRRELAAAVLTTDGIIAAPGSPKAGKNADGTEINTHWAASSYLYNGYAVNAQTRAATQALVAQLGPAVADLVIARLPKGSDPVTQDEVTEALKVAFREAFSNA